MYCVMCGQILRDDAKFCGKCGAPQSLKPMKFAAITMNNYADVQQTDELLTVEAESDIAQAEIDVAETETETAEIEKTADMTKTHAVDEDSYVFPDPVTENDKITGIQKRFNLGVNDEFSLGTDCHTGEPVLWKVLTVKESKALIISSETVFEMPYNETNGSFSWQECTLRKYLNGGYLEEYFTQAEKERIIPCRIVNDDTYDLNADACDSESDRVFLLSAREAKHYFPDNDSRTAGTGWWLRYVRRYPHCAPSVDDRGIVHPAFERQRLSEGTGAFGHGIVRGIRPAMWIALDV